MVGCRIAGVRLSLALISWCNLFVRCSCSCFGEGRLIWLADDCGLVWGLSTLDYGGGSASVEFLRALIVMSPCVFPAFLFVIACSNVAAVIRGRGDGPCWSVVSI